MPPWVLVQATVRLPPRSLAPAIREGVNDRPALDLLKKPSTDRCHRPIADILEWALSYCASIFERPGGYDVVDKRRIFTAALVAVMVASLTTVVLYILLVVVSFFVVMPSAAQSIMWVGGLLLVIFAVTFVMAFRKLVSKFMS